jgi:hypothetical protein
LFVFYLGQRWDHHQYQPDGNGNIGGSDLKMVDHVPYAGEEIPPNDPGKRGQKNPQGLLVCESFLTGKFFQVGFRDLTATAVVLTDEQNLMVRAHKAPPFFGWGISG